MTSSVEMLALVVKRLGDLRERVVFLGGSVIPLLITDPAAPPPRTTADVDLIVEAGTRREYHLPGDEISQARVPVVMARLRGIAAARGRDPAAGGG